MLPSVTGSIVQLLLTLICLKIILIITVNLINSPIALDTRKGVFTYHPLIDLMSDFQGVAVAINSPPFGFLWGMWIFLYCC